MPPRRVKKPPVRAVPDVAAKAARVVARLDAAGAPAARVALVDSAAAADFPVGPAAVAAVRACR